MAPVSTEVSLVFKTVPRHGTLMRLPHLCTSLKFRRGTDRAVAFPAFHQQPVSTSSLLWNRRPPRCYFRDPNKWKSDGEGEDCKVVGSQHVTCCPYQVQPPARKRKCLINTNVQAKETHLPNVPCSHPEDAVSNLGPGGGNISVRDVAIPSLHCARSTHGRFVLHEMLQHSERF
jgi:hypothetical protein